MLVKSDELVLFYRTYKNITHSLAKFILLFILHLIILCNHNAIKLLDYLTCFSVDWKMQTELNIMRRFSHPNLVNLLGYCWDDDEHLLVYEFMPKGSLDNYLFKSMD